MATKKYIGYCFTAEEDLKNKRKKFFEEKKDRGNIYYRYDPLYQEMCILVESLDHLDELKRKVASLKLSIENKKLIDYYFN